MTASQPQSIVFALPYFGYSVPGSGIVPVNSLSAVTGDLSSVDRILLIGVSILLIIDLLIGIK